MSGMFQFFQSDASIWLCHTLVHSLWQFAVLAFLAFCVQRLRSSNSAESAYRVHVIAMAVGIVAFAATFFLQTQVKRQDPIAAVNPPVASEPESVDEPGQQQVHVPSHAPPGFDHHLARETEFDESDSPIDAGAPIADREQEAGFQGDMMLWIASAYVVGVACMLLRLILSCRRVSRLRTNATVLTSGRYFESMQTLTETWSKRAKPLIAVSRDVLVPQVVGFTRATILLPASALSGLSTSELEMILAHELAHIRRHDMWVQLVQRLAETVLFFNPALWYLSRRISTLREYCCDDATCGTRNQQESIDNVQTQYAVALLRVAEDGLGVEKSKYEPRVGVELASLAAVGHSPSELRRRVARLLGEPMREPLQIPRRSLFVVTGVLTLWMCSVVWSGPADAPPENDQPTETVNAKPDDKTDTEATATAEAENKEELEPWKIRIPVSGQIQLPDGSPAANVIVMTATDKFGWGEGFTNGSYTKTDKDGRYEIQSKRFFPQRLFWLPDDYENNSRAVTEGGGEQKVVRLKPAPRITGTIKDGNGKPQAGIMIRADGASRTPMTWARSNANGEFKFRPLPAGDYRLMPVRSYHAHQTGQLSSSPLPVPFEYMTYTLTADAKPVKLVAPETVSIRVQVVDFEGEPVTGKRVSLGDIGDYSNALIANEVADEPGFYEFRHPKGHYIRDLKLRHSWDQIVYYQEKPGLDPIAGSCVVLGKANDDVDGIKIIVGQSAKLTLKLVDSDGNPITKDFDRVSTQIGYPDQMYPSNRPVREPRGTTMSRANDPSWREIPGLVPDCDLKLSIHGDKINDIKQRVRLSPGENRELTIVVNVRSTATLRGTILTADGKSPAEKGWMYSKGTLAPVNDKNSTTMRSYGSTEGDFLDSFQVEIPAGTTTLSHFAKGYAPSWLGPIDIEAGKDRDNLKIVLKPGFSFPVHVTDHDGNPIAGAKLSAFPVINGSTNGPVFEQWTDDNGVLQYEHAAETKYEFAVKADGYGDFRSEPMEVAAGKPIKLALTESPITSGTVYDSNGRPAPDAKIYLSIENVVGGRTNLAFNENTLLATTDEDGKFLLRQLSNGTEYLTFVKLLDESRVLTREIVPGAKDLQIHVPERRDLKIKIVGNLNLLIHRKGKPTINVRQNVSLKTEDHSAGNLLGTAIVVTPLKSGEGGIAVYKGLVSGNARVYGGGVSKTVDVAEEGDTEVEINLE